MEDRKPLTKEQRATLRAEGRVPLSPFATKMATIAAVIITTAILLQGLPARIKQLRVLLAADDPELATPLVSMVLNVIGISSCSVLVVGVLAVLMQTAGMIVLRLVHPRIRWFQGAVSVAAMGGAAVAGMLCGAVLWWCFAGLIFAAGREPLARAGSLLVSTVIQAGWVLAGLLVVIGIAAAVVVRVRFR
jgi:hypothetical protein